MSRKLVIECDHDGGCSNVLDGFKDDLTESRLVKLMEERGWQRTVDDDGWEVDYCEEHKKGLKTS